MIMARVSLVLLLECLVQAVLSSDLYGLNPGFNSENLKTAFAKVSEKADGINEIGNSPIAKELVSEFNGNKVNFGDLLTGAAGGPKVDETVKKVGNNLKNGEMNGIVELVNEARKIAPDGKKIGEIGDKKKIEEMVKKVGNELKNGKTPCPKIPAGKMAANPNGLQNEVCDMLRRQLPKNLSDPKEVDKLIASIKTAVETFDQNTKIRPQSKFQQKSAEMTKLVETLKKINASIESEVKSVLSEVRPIIGELLKTTDRKLAKDKVLKELTNTVKTMVVGAMQPIKVDGSPSKDSVQKKLEAKLQDVFGKSAKVDQKIKAITAKVGASIDKESIVVDKELKKFYDETKVGNGSNGPANKTTKKTTTKTTKKTTVKKTTKKAAPTTTKKPTPKTTKKTVKTTKKTTKKPTTKKAAAKTTKKTTKKPTTKKTTIKTTKKTTKKPTTKKAAAKTTKKTTTTTTKAPTTKSGQTGLRMSTMVIVTAVAMVFADKRYR